MKNILSITVCLLFSIAVFGQSGMIAEKAASSTAYLSDVYQLEQSQKAEMLVIQERKYRNLEEIAHLRTENPTLYIQKLRSVQVGTDASLKKLLNEQQEDILNEKKAANRRAVANNYHDMRKKGLSQAEMEEKIIKQELALLENH